MNLTNLVFEGGGVKGVAFCGAIRALEESKILDGITNIIGSSAGAICAGLLAVKFTANELEDALKNLDMCQLTDDTIGFIRDIYRLFSYFGIYRGDAFSVWYGNLIEKKTGNKDITFQQVFDRYNINLTITGTCLNKQKTIYFNKSTYPGLPIVKAVRISMSIPGVFCAVEMDECIFVDGGVLNNYPIDYYGNIENTLGFKLASKKNPDNDTHIIPIDGIKDFLTSVVNSMMSEIERSHIMTGYWDHTICIDCFGISSTEFNISEDNKEKLIREGYTSTKNWIQMNNID